MFEMPAEPLYPSPGWIACVDLARYSESQRQEARCCSEEHAQKLGAINPCARNFSSPSSTSFPIILHAWKMFPNRRNVAVSSDFLSRERWTFVIAWVQMVKGL